MIILSGTFVSDGVYNWAATDNDGEQVKRMSRQPAENHIASAPHWLNGFNCVVTVVYAVIYKESYYKNWK